MPTGIVGVITSDQVTQARRDNAENAIEYNRLIEQYNAENNADFKPFQVLSGNVYPSRNGVYENNISAPNTGSDQFLAPPESQIDLVKLLVPRSQ
jgi:hypothetical protein